MKDTLKPGLQYKSVIEIDKGRTIGFMGEDLRVYSTPNIVHDLEYACREFILEHLDEGEDTVGASVEVQHAKPTPLGFTATHTITIDSIDRRRVVCRVSVHDGVEEVATGTHTRFIVDIERLKSAIKTKQSQKGA